MTSSKTAPRGWDAGITLVELIIYIAVGLAAVWIGRDYAPGTGSRMGPGYFPTLLGWLLALFGMLSVLRSLVQDGSAVGTVMVSIQADEDDGTAALFLRDFREIFRQAEHRRDAAAIVARSFEPAILVRGDIDGFVRGAGQCAPDQSGFEVRHFFDGR